MARQLEGGIPMTRSLHSMEGVAVTRLFN